MNVKSNKPLGIETASKVLIEAASPALEIQVLWLYGSQARGDADSSSDVDLAVAMEPAGACGEIIESFRAAAAKTLNKSVSVVDINNIPVPLAINIINQGRVLLCRSAFRLRQEELRIWSLWEAVKYESRRYSN